MVEWLSCVLSNAIVCFLFCLFVHCLSVGLLVSFVVLYSVCMFILSVCPFVCLSIKRRCVWGGGDAWDVNAHTRSEKGAVVSVGRKGVRGEEFLCLELPIQLRRQVGKQIVKLIYFYPTGII